MIFAFLCKTSAIIFFSISPSMVLWTNCIRKIQSACYFGDFWSQPIHSESFSSEFQVFALKKREREQNNFPWWLILRHTRVYMPSSCLLHMFHNSPTPNFLLSLSFLFLYHTFCLFTLSWIFSRPSTFSTLKYLPLNILYLPH